MTAETGGRGVDLQEANRRLEGASPQEILRWGVETFYPKLTMATAFGPEGCAILHMLSRIEPKVRVFNLDTGYQFAETLQLRDRIAERYGVEVELVRADRTVAEYEAANGGPVYADEPDRCCHDRKIIPLRRAIVGYDAWISAIRADQSAHRAKASVVGRDQKFGLVKLNPLPPVVASGRLGLRRLERRALQPAARPRLPVDRLLALHAGRLRGRGRRTGRPLGGAGEDRMRPAFAGQQPALRGEEGR